jgi:hypothetical protein
LHRGRDALRIVLHTLKANVDREVAPTCFAVEDLNVTALVVSQSIFRNLG